MSSNHFNGLTAEEDELLTVLEEECAEVIQAITKIRRHGLASYHPDNPGVSNAGSLHRELGDVRAAMILLSRIGILHLGTLPQLAKDKLKRLQPYLHHHVIRGVDTTEAD